VAALNCRLTRRTAVAGPWAWMKFDWLAFQALRSCLN
jgi:hypothetical protein